MTRQCYRCSRSIGAATRVCPICVAEVRRKWPKQIGPDTWRLFSRWGRCALKHDPKWDYDEIRFTIHEGEGEGIVERWTVEHSQPGAFFEGIIQRLEWTPPPRATTEEIAPIMRLAAQWLYELTGDTGSETT